MKKPYIIALIILGIVLLAALLIVPALLKVRANKVDPESILVIMNAHGGLCAPGTQCTSEMTIKRNGNYVDKSPQNPNGDITGTIAIEKMNILADIIEKTDFEEMRKAPFAGTCPTAFDGQQIVYTFFTSHGIEKIDSCKTQINENSPLFMQLFTLED